MDVITKNVNQLTKNVNQLRVRFFEPKRIRLAVVGAPSSGKSFLLKDIIDALGCLGYAIYDSDRLEREDGFRYTDFGNYSPNQKGGNGQTPVYACRHRDHYGHRMSGDGKKFDLDFLNIPGEIFTEERLRGFNSLKRELDKNSALFVECTYVNQAGDRRLIVEAREEFSRIKEVRKSTETVKENTLLFWTWSQIFGELNAGGYQCTNRRALTGKELLKEFFRYDTDSVMQSIADLIANRQITCPEIQSVDTFYEFHMREFVFFHYCSLATDIVVCDRVFEPKNEPKFKEITFAELSKQLKQFLRVESHVKNIHLYLALRNIDYLLQKPEVEQAYQQLLAKLKQQPDALSNGGCAWRNALYSLFAYTLMGHVGLLNPTKTVLDELLGMDAELVKELPDNAKELEKRFLDIEQSQQHLHKSSTVRLHIQSRVNGFRPLLQQTKWKQRNDMSVGVPHVHFSCTPITEYFEVFRNADETKGQEAGQFYRDGMKETFSGLNSNMCFGSLQLCIDILKQHEMIGGDIATGNLLKDIFDLHD